MKEYCRNYKTDSVVCYCHYCLEGLKTGGVDGMHLAEMIFNLSSPAQQLLYVTGYNDLNQGLGNNMGIKMLGEQ